MEHSHPLLASLDADQQHLVDVVAEAFLAEDYEWPYFDYVEGVLDDDGLDALGVLQSFPTLGSWGYGVVAWQRNNSPESEVALTVLGMSHSAALRDNVAIFFELVDYLSQRRREARAQPRSVRNLTVTSDEFDVYWRTQRRLSLPPRMTRQLGEHEPPTRYGSGSWSEDGSWTRSPARQLLAFEGLETIEDYVDRLEKVLGSAAPPLPPILPSPLSLAAALDYLNVVWRLTHERQRLFAFANAERTTRLAFDVQTAEEFAAHLSAFADILREANKRLSVGGARKNRDHPLARIDADLAARLEPDAAARTAEAVRTLELVIALRDADQHGAANARAVDAHRNLRLPYPITDWHSAWTIVSAQAINALSALREELSAADE